MKVTEKIVIVNGTGYLVPLNKTKNPNKMSDEEYSEYIDWVKTFPVHSNERTITNEEFSNLENKNWHR